MQRRLTDEQRDSFGEFTSMAQASFQVPGRILQILLAAHDDAVRMEGAIRTVDERFPDAYVHELIFSKRTAIRQLKAALTAPGEGGGG